MLAKDFHGIIGVFARALSFLDKEYLSEATLAQQADYANRSQVDVLAKVLWCIWPTSLHDMVIQADSFLGLMILRMQINHALKRVR